MKSRISIEWIAGLVDGEGSFNIQLKEKPSTSKHNPGTYIMLYAVISIGLKGSDAKYLQMARDFTGIGKIYHINKHKKKDYNCRWQCINRRDCIALTKLLLPHLRVKKRIAERFLSACEMLISTGDNLKERWSGQRRYSADTVHYVAKVASTLNERSAKRYKNYKDYTYWKARINKLYGKSSGNLEESEIRCEDLKATITYPWLAGFLDGEGSLACSSGQSSHSYSFSPTVILNQREKWILERIKETLKLGTIYLDKADNSSPNDVYRWMVTGQNECEQIVKKLLPYLLIKKAVARKFLLILRLIKRHRRPQNEWRYKGAYSEEIGQRIMKLAKRLNESRR